MAASGSSFCNGRRKFEGQFSQNRWKILRTFIKNGNRNVQYKHRHAFGLFRSCKIPDWRLLSFDNGCQNHVDYEWLLYTCEQFPTCRLAVRYAMKLAAGVLIYLTEGNFHQFCAGSVLENDEIVHILNCAHEHRKQFDFGEGTCKIYCQLFALIQE